MFDYLKKPGRLALYYIDILKQDTAGLDASDVITVMRDIDRKVWRAILWIEDTTRSIKQATSPGSKQVSTQASKQAGITAYSEKGKHTYEQGRSYAS